MQTITGKEITLSRRSELSTLLAEAKKLHKDALSLRGVAESYMNSALERALKCGRLLNEMKEIVGHGNWIDFLKTHWTELSESTWQRYMKIARENPKAARVRDLKFDSIRKHCITFVPEKEQPEHQGNAKFPRLASFLNIVNEFERVVQRHCDGLQLIDWDEVREETSKLYQTLKWVHGDATQPPFKA